MRVLVPISEDDESAEALPEAVVRAGNDGEIVLASIGEIAEVPEQADEARAMMTEHLDRVAADVSGIPVKQRIELAGDPVRGIIEIAREESVDQIVIASSHHGHFRQLIEGSVASELQSELQRIPVEIVSAE